MKLKDLPTSTKGFRVLEVQNGRIDSASLSTADHGLLSSFIFIDFSGSGCGFGGYALGKEDGNLPGTGHCAEWIARVLKVAEVTEWKDLPGRPVRALTEGWGGSIVALGHFLKDEWFCPKVEWPSSAG